MRTLGITNAAAYSSAPAVGSNGDMYWNTANSTLYVAQGGAWVAWPTGGGANPLPPGGAFTSVLTKKSAADYDVNWSVSATGPQANSWMARDANGNAQVGTALVAADIANKGYVDLLDGGTKNAAFGAVANTFYRLNAAASLGSLAITLPTIPADRTRIRLFRQDNNFYSTSWTVTAGGSDTIIGGQTNTTWTVGGQNAYVEFTYYAANTNWAVTSVGWQGLGNVNYAAVGAAFNPSIMLRDSSGRSQVSDFPASGTEIANKNYVDGRVYTITAATATLQNRDTIEVDCTSNNVTVTCPATAGNVYTIKRIDNTSNTCTVTMTTGLIDGDANLYLVGQHASAQLVCDGAANTRITSGYGVGSAASPAPWQPNIWQVHNGQQVTSIINGQWNGPFTGWANVTPGGGQPIAPLVGGAATVNAANDGALLLINFTICWANNTTGRRILAVFINNSEANRTDLPSPLTMAQQVTHIYRAAAGDVIDLRVWQTTGANLALNPQGAGHWMQFARIG
jgi:hypothetical protein